MQFFVRFQRYCSLEKEKETKRECCRGFGPKYCVHECRWLCPISAPKNMKTKIGKMKTEELNWKRFSLKQTKKQKKSYFQIKLKLIFFCFFCFCIFFVFFLYFFCYKNFFYFYSPNFFKIFFVSVIKILFNFFHIFFRNFYYGNVIFYFYYKNSFYKFSTSKIENETLN